MDDSYKSLERKSLERTTTRLPEEDRQPAKAKEGRSVFDDLLDQAARITQNGLQNKPNKTLTQQALQELTREREKDREHSKEKDKDDQNQKRREDKSETVLDGKKILGRSELKPNQDHSGGGSFQGDGRAGSRDAKRSHLATKKLGGSDDLGKIGGQIFAKEFQQKLTQSLSAPPKVLPEALLSQIVKLVRVKSFQDGGHLCEVDCRDEVFQGLSLRFSSRHGKVKIAFLTGNAETKALFEREAAKITAALQQRGVEVEELRVL